MQTCVAVNSLQFHIQEKDGHLKIKKPFLFCLAITPQEPHHLLNPFLHAVSKHLFLKQLNTGQNIIYKLNQGKAQFNKIPFFPSIELIS